LIGLFLCLLAFYASYVCGRRALGHGLGATLAVGYGYGILRANFPDGGSHFIFDAAILGLYGAAFRQGGSGTARPGPVRAWVIVLAVWPCLVALVPFNHVLVQLVGLRAAIFFLPLVLVGARLEERDLELLARWLVRLNLIALAFGAAEFVLGIERFYPHNAVTDIIYRSTDVGAARHHRIPAIFPNAHAYGGSMVATLPILASRLGGVPLGRERWLTIAAIVAAVLGVFLCAARLTAVGLLVVGGVTLLVTPAARRAKFGVAAVAIVVVLLVSQSERLQRFSLLADPDAVALRVSGSVNLGLLEIFLDYPMGAGLGSAVGTSMPFFLLHLAPQKIGMESEFGRIAIEQSLIGLGLWVVFIVLTLTRRPRRRKRSHWSVAIPSTRSFVAFSWLTAFIGTGLLSSIPGTLLVLLSMGLLWNDDWRDRRPGRGVSPEPSA
jgi:hypothetical protein